MNQMTNHERPGVYSSYEASAVVSGRGGGAVVGLIARSDQGAPETVTVFYDDENLSAQFTDDIGALFQLLVKNGASAVAVCPVGADEDYEKAFAAMGAADDISLIVCDSAEIAVQKKLKEALEEAAAVRKERIAIVPAGKGETVAQLTQRAEALNSQRMVLVAPAAEDALPHAALAAAVAGAIAAEADPAVPLGGAPLKGVESVSQTYSEESLDALIRGGVTVAEMSRGEVSILRAVTTRTKTGGAADATWKELTTIRIVDDVIPTVREALKVRFGRSKNTAQVRSAIRSQVIMELEEKVSKEIITGYGAVNAVALEDNPTVCLVEFSFTVAHGLNQIWLSAKITV